MLLFRLGVLVFWGGVCLFVLDFCWIWGGEGFLIVLFYKNRERLSNLMENECVYSFYG